MWIKLAYMSWSHSFSHCGKRFSRLSVFDLYEDICEVIAKNGVVAAANSNCRQNEINAILTGLSHYSGAQPKNVKKHVLTRCVVYSPKVSKIYNTMPETLVEDTVAFVAHENIQI
jgi:hypothetical protein